MRQRFILAGGGGGWDLGPAGVWTCAGCGAELHSAGGGTYMNHRRDCVEIARLCAVRAVIEVEVEGDIL